MTRRKHVILWQEDNDEFSAAIAEYPGCFATGATVKKAWYAIQDAADEWEAAAQEAGQSIPDASDPVVDMSHLRARVAKLEANAAAVRALVAAARMFVEWWAHAPDVGPLDPQMFKELTDALAAPALAEVVAQVKEE